MQQACIDSRKANTNLKLSLLKGSLECLKFPLLKFNIPVTYFLKYFRAQFREILMSGSREKGVFPKVRFFIQLQVFDLLHMRYISLGSLGNRKRWEVLGTLPFLAYRYLCNKRLKPSIHCVDL